MVSSSPATALLRVEGGRGLALGSRTLQRADCCHVAWGEYELLFDLDRNGAVWNSIERWTEEEYQRLRKVMQQLPPSSAAALKSRTV